MTISNKEKIQRRKNRVRRLIKKSVNNYPRFSVFRSSKYIYVQIINDVLGETIVSASSIEKKMKSKLKTGSNIIAATEIGKLIAKRASAAGIVNVVFDRGSYLYHGRVKAVAESARNGGLKF